MTNANPVRKTVATKVIGTCTCCGTKLKNPGTVIPGLGIFGPKCELNAMNALSHLENNGLGELLRQGELRFKLLRESATVYHLPQEAISQYSVCAARVGLKLRGRVENGDTYVMSICPSSLRDFLKRHKGMASLAVQA